MIDPQPIILFSPLSKLHKNISESHSPMAENMPMAPESIPAPEFPSTPPQRPHRTASNPLDFPPCGGFFSFLHLPGIIIGTMLISYIIGRLHFCFLFLIPIAHIVYFFFRRRAKAYTRTVEALSHSQGRQEALGEFESVEWINYIIRKFWEVAEAGVSSQIYSEVNKELKKNTPSFLKSLRLTELTLGTRPPVIERIGFMEKADDIITIESAFNFIPIETSEDILYYFGDEKTHWNTCIELTATVGFVNLPILVRNFTFSGLIRMQIELTRRIPFLKTLSISMLEQPFVDFQLHPLRAADFMDLPYLAGAIRKIISTAVSKTVLFPKSIDIDLTAVADYRGKRIGVVFAYVHSLRSLEQESVRVSLSAGGAEFAQTARQAGRDPVFNEGFYEIVSDTTQSINISLQTPSEHFAGRYFLRNLNKHSYTEMVHLSSDASRRFLSVSNLFFPITQVRTDAAIISMTLVSIRDLQALNSPKNRLYSTYALITLETKDSIRVRKVLKTFETKRIFSTKDPFYNENISFFVKYFPDYILKIKIMDDKSDAVLGSLILPLENADVQGPGMYRISGVESGTAEIKFEMAYIDMQPVEQEGSPFSEVSVKQLESDEWEERELDDDVSEVGGLVDGEQPGVQPAGAKVPEVHPMNLGIYTLEKPENCLVSYTKVFKLSLKSISDQGSFYMVFETNHLLRKMEPFSTEVPISKHVFVPVADEEFVRVRLFRMLQGGDTLVGEEVYKLGDTVLLFDWVRVELESEMRELTSDEAMQNDLRVVQCVIAGLSIKDPASHRGSVFTAELYAGENFMAHGIVGSVMTLCTGDEALRGVIRENGSLLVSFMFDAESYEQELTLAPGITASIRVKARTCGFKFSEVPARGLLEVFILKVLDVKGARNPYVKVFLNSEKVFKTSGRGKGENAVFREKFRIAVAKDTDVLSFYISDFSAIAPSSIICYKEFSLLNLECGFTRLELEMRSGTDGSPVSARLQVVLNYEVDSREAAAIS